MFVKDKPQDLLKLFMENEAVPAYKKERFLKYIK